MSAAPGGEDGGILGEEHSLHCVVTAEEGGAVDDNTVEGHHETLVETTNTISGGDGLKAVEHALEFSCIALAHVCSQAGTGKVEWVHDEKRGGASGTSRGEVTGKIAPELSLLIDSRKEPALIGVLEGEVERLGREVANHVREVASPEGKDTVLGRDAPEAVNLDKDEDDNDNNGGSHNLFR